MTKPTLIKCWGNPRKAKLYAQWATEHLHGLRSVLDIGAGDGAVAEVLPAGVVYSGLDIGADIYNRTGRVHYIEDFPSLRSALAAHEGADLTTIFDVLEHTDDFVTLFRDGARKSEKFLFVSLPNEMSLDCRIRFLLGTPVPAHGLSLLNAKPGHKHNWLIKYTEAKAILISEAKSLGFTLHAEVFIVNLPSTAWKRLLAQFFCALLPADAIAHGIGFVFKRTRD